MKGIAPNLGIMGDLKQDRLDPPAAPASALCALNSVLGDKAPPSFVPLTLTSLIHLKSYIDLKIIQPIQPGYALSNSEKAK